MLSLCSAYCLYMCITIFFFNDTATTEIYTLSLHDALPISQSARAQVRRDSREAQRVFVRGRAPRRSTHDSSGRIRCARSEEHTSELQSQSNLVCRLLLEKKKLLLSIS